MLTRDEIFAAKPEIVTLAVPEWGGSVGLKKLTLKQRDDFIVLSAKSKDSKQAGELLASMVVACACNENGQPIFTEGDVAGLQERQADIIDRVAKEAFKLNGLNAEDSEETKKDSAATEKPGSATA